MRKSWALNAQDTHGIYDMGSIDDIFDSNNPRLTKKHFKQAIRKEWNIRTKEEFAGKSSLRWLHLLPNEQLHIIWRHTNCQSHTRKATIKATMTTGCYILQADVKRFNQNEFNATCLLCDIGEPENIDHFLCRCSYPPIKDFRERFLPRLITLHWGLIDSTNIMSTMRSSNWYWTVLPTTLMSHTHTRHSMACSREPC